MTEALLQDTTSTGASLDRLEKADVLELTVEHLKKMRAQGTLQATMPMAQQQSDKFREGYTRCATEVAQCLTALPEGSSQVNVTLGARLMAHLGTSFTHHEKTAPLTITVPQQTSALCHSVQQTQGLLMPSILPCSTVTSASPLWCIPTSSPVTSPATSPTTSPVFSSSLYTPPASPVSVLYHHSPSQTMVPTTPVWPRPW